MVKVGWVLCAAVVFVVLTVLGSTGVVFAQVRCAFDGSVQVSEVFAQVNRLRVKAGLPVLRMDARLTRVAQRHGCDMRAYGFFAHKSPTSGSVGERATREGYVWCAVAENLAKGQDTPSEAVQGWMSSRGHRRNILDDRMTETGIAWIPRGPYGGPYWIQVFAARC
jgi:uncharacterized protein YkwD